MKRYIRSSKSYFPIFASTKMADIQPIAKNSAEEQKLESKIDQEYESICPYYADWYERFYYRGKWKNTDDGIQFITTTWMSPTEPQYNEEYLKPVPLEYVYRAVSIAEYEYILKTGQIRSNSSMNIGYEVDRGLTCYHKSYPGWYLPDEGGYILKVKATPDMFIDDVDEYIKTPSPVNISNIVEVNGIPV